MQLEDQEKRLAALLEKDLIQISNFFGVEEARLIEQFVQLEQSIRELEQSLGAGAEGGSSRGGSTTVPQDRGEAGDAEELGGMGKGPGQQVRAAVSMICGLLGVMLYFQQEHGPHLHGFLTILFKVSVINN